MRSLPRAAIRRGEKESARRRGFDGANLKAHAVEPAGKEIGAEVARLTEEVDLPDVFIIPCDTIYKYYKGGDSKTWPWPRYHETVDNLEPYKNRWDLIEKALSSTR
jgi:hypothetical protein